MWRLKNPLGTKAQCVRETGLSKPTVYKWWEYAEKKIQSLEVKPKYEKYSDIPLSYKKYLYKQMQSRYVFNDDMLE